MVEKYLKVPSSTNSDQELVKLRYDALILILEYKVACQEGYEHGFKSFLKFKEIDYRQYDKSIKFSKLNSKIIRSFYLSDLVLNDSKLEKEVLAVFHKVISNVKTVPSFAHIEI